MVLHPVQFVRLWLKAIIMQDPYHNLIRRSLILDKSFDLSPFISHPAINSTTSVQIFSRPKMAILLGKPHLPLPGCQGPEWSDVSPEVCRLYCGGGGEDRLAVWTDCGTLCTTGGTLTSFHGGG